MFECQACFRRFIRSLNSTSEIRPLTFATGPSQTRSIYTASRTSRTTPKSGRSTSTRNSEEPKRWADSPQAAQRRGDVRKVLRTSEAEYEHHSKRYAGQESRWRREDLRPRLSIFNAEAKAEREEKDLRIELRWLADPLKLSEHIEKLLRQQNWDKALALVRLSDRGAAQTVSWNHLLNYQMKTGQMKGAIKLYNEMKKRAQKPDSHTFTILFRGLADLAHYPNALGTALQLYHSMSAENSKVQANIIHTNALLKICSRAGDLDSMWDIASKLPERGSYAANAWTFTTFLQTMREQAILSSKASDPDTAALKREQMIIEGRKLWAVIVTRWRQGEIVVDEDLVCAMGRLLLVGSRPRDWDDVLSLVQQSMAIPRQVPALGTQARKHGGQIEIRTQRVEGPVRVVPQQFRGSNAPQNLRIEQSTEEDEEEDQRPGIEFEDTYGLEKGQKLPSPSAAARAHARGMSLYAEPGNNTLSLLLEASLKTVAVDAGLSYWRLLTNPDDKYVIMPDSNNIHVLLRLLRQKRDSTTATNVLLHDMRELRLPYLHKTLRIALSACVRDATNAQVMDNAEKILDIMIEKFPEDADLNVLVQYIDVANKAAELSAKNEKPANKHKNSGQGNLRFDVTIMIRAIERLTPFAFDTLKQARANLKLFNSDDTNNTDETAMASTVESDTAATSVPRKLLHTTTKPTNDMTVILELERSLIRLYDRVIEAVREARAASKNPELAPWGLTGEMIERYTARSARLTSSVNKGASRQSGGRVMTVRDTTAKDMRARRLLRQAQAIARADPARQKVVEGQSSVEEDEVFKKQEEEEEDFGKRRWTPGVKPKSGIARAFAMG